MNSSSVLSLKFEEEVKKEMEKCGPRLLAQYFYYMFLYFYKHTTIIFYFLLLLQHNKIFIKLSNGCPDLI